MSTIAKILAVLTLMPIVEIGLLIPLHNLIGGWWTVGLVVFTAMLGTILIRWQGAAALRRIKEAIGEGRLPSDELLDGVLILLASVALITPGVITDTTGLLLLVPSLRAPVRRLIGRRVSRWLGEKASPGGAGFGDLGHFDAPHREPAQKPEPAWQKAAEDGASIGRPDEIL